MKDVEPTEGQREADCLRWLRGQYGKNATTSDAEAMAEREKEAESRGERRGLERAAKFAETQGKAYSNMAQLAKCIRALAAQGER